MGLNQILPARENKGWASLRQPSHAERFRRHGQGGNSRGVGAIARQTMTEGQASTPTSPEQWHRFALLGFGLTLLLLLLGGVLGYINAERLAHHRRWVDHSHQVLMELEGLTISLVDAETGQRGYLITEEEGYLEPYTAGEAAAQDKLRRLQELTSDNTDQQERLKALRSLVERRLEVLNQNIQRTKRGEKEAVVQAIRSGLSKQLMDESRARIAEMEQQERALLEARTEEAQTSHRTLLALISLSAVSGLALVSAVFLLSQRNVRLHQRTAHTIAEQRERLRTTLASIGDAVLSTDLDGRVTNMNAVAERLTGWKNREALGQPLEAVFRIVNETTRQPAANPASRALAEGVIVGLANHTVLIAKDGTERPIDDSAAPIRCQDGEIVGCVLVFRDVTERRKAERLLETSEAQSRAVIETSLDCIVTIDHHSRVLEFNPAAERTFGYTRQEVMGRDISEFIIPPAFREQHHQGMARYLQTGEGPVLNRRLELAAVRRDGSEFPVELTVTRNPAGGPPRFTAHLRDITDRKRMENDLRQHAADMSETDRRKNEFLAMLAHELRNPLAPIRNAVQIVKLAGGHDAAVASASEMMERQLGQMVRLVDDLLDVSRISRGKIELRKERVDLTMIVHNAVEATRPLSQCMAHQLDVHLPPQPIYLHADPARLTQVLHNLLNNACKFTDEGGRISLSIEREGSQAVIRVRDNGIGVAAEQLPRIFEMFMQIDTSLERTVGGLGIGLTLVKNLVDMHEGTVEVRSEGLGRGCEFIVRLPLAKDEGGRMKDEPESDSSFILHPSSFSSKRVLVVDDNVDAATTLAMLLKLHGHQTHTAHDGEEALQSADELRPEVMLLDIGLPKLNGYEVARRLREQPWGREILLVALTGWGQEEDRQRSKEAGFDGHLVKPVDLEALKRLLAARN